MNDPKYSRMPAGNFCHVFWRLASGVWRLAMAIPSKPSSAAPNNQAAAGTGTADTEPPEKSLKALIAAASVGSQAGVARIPSPPVLLAV